MWTDPAKARFKARHFKAIKDGGFQTVRMNLQAFAHMDAANRLAPAWVATLDRLVGVALDQGLTVILDEHDFNACGQDLPTCEPRLTAFWRQVAAHYAKAPGKLVFEILNEPNGQLDDEAWNRLLAIELKEIRSINPTRTVIVGPASWNSPQHLEALRLPPDDHHLIVTVHYYAPMEFTHQGAPWTPQFAHLSGVTWGAQEDLRKLDQDFSQVAAGPPRTSARSCWVSSAPTRRAIWDPASATSPPWPARPSGAVGPGPTGSSIPTSSPGT